jgi:hypothetical protein
VAITRLAKHGGIVSLFVRFVKHYIRYLFACWAYRNGPFLPNIRTGYA